MKIKFLLCLFIVILGTIPANAAGLKAVFSFSTFNTTENKPFLETYLAISPKKLSNFKNDNGYFKSIKISLKVYKDKEIVFSDNYNLNTTSSTDSLLLSNFDILDQKRIGLPNGDYVLNIEMVDALNPKISANINQYVSIKYNITDIQLSDVSLIESYTKSTANNLISKSGYDMIPMVDNIFYPEINTINFYTEVYNIDKSKEDENFLVNYYISKEDNKVIENYFAFKKLGKKPVVPILTSFNISNLKAGNYYLNVDVKNIKSEIVATKRVYFERKSNITEIENLDSIPANIDYSAWIAEIKAMPEAALNENINYLFPLSNDIEKQFATSVLASKELEKKQSFFSTFWSNKYPNNPSISWAAYLEKIKYVNEKYSNFMRKGYLTDQGTCYLKYGIPTRIFIEPYNANTVPYEIWEYNAAARQTNLTFVFYQAGGEEYTLLHSNARGEKQDPQWRFRLQKITNVTTDDRIQPDNNFGGKTDRYNNSTITTQPR